MPLKPRICLIGAMAKNRVVGGNNRLLWHLPADLKHFRSLTSGHTVLMGRKTWDSLPERVRPLPGRRNLVCSTNPLWHAEGAERVASVEQALALSANAPELWVIGGGEIWTAALPYAHRVSLTEIHQDFEGDTHFPLLPAGWVEVQRECHRAAAPNDYDFDFVTYERPAPKGDS